MKSGTEAAKLPSLSVVRPVMKNGGMPAEPGPSGIPDKPIADSASEVPTVKPLGSLWA